MDAVCAGILASKIHPKWLLNLRLQAKFRNSNLIFGVKFELKFYR
ncbi:hypothetical protein [uncultured Campylobacter sp.]|nr:hypothetical protein [uncultured Campylobacter sp.]